MARAPYPNGSALSAPTAAATIVQAASVPTVTTHVVRILSRLGLRDRIQAVVPAYETGFVQPGEG